MDVLVDRCAGIDIGKAELAVCVRTPGKQPGKRDTEQRRFATMTKDILALREWLLERKVTRVVMESTGVYWKPVYYLLEDTFEVILANPQQVKNLPGRKSDTSDAKWLCQLAECELIRASFVPPAPIRGLRMLTRLRQSLVAERTRERNRINAMLEDAGIKLGVVASDIFGVSGQLIMDALVAGERDPQALAELACGRLRAKNAALVEALTGRFTVHHAFVLDVQRRHLAQLEQDLAALEGRIDTELAPFRRQLELLLTIPGMGRTAAAAVIAEIGVDMTRFPTPGQLASWAGVAPAMHESAGKRSPAGTRPGNKHLRAILGEVALAAAKTKGTYLGERYSRIARRRGKKRAIVATQHVILDATWHMLTADAPYEDLGPEHFTKTIKDKHAALNHHLSQIQALGYTVRLEPAA